MTTAERTLNQSDIQLQTGDLAKFVNLKEDTRFSSGYNGRGEAVTGITVAAGTKVNYTVKGNKRETWYTASCLYNGQKYSATRTVNKPFIS